MLAWDTMRIDPAYRERLRSAGLDSMSRVLARVDGVVAAWSRSTETLQIPGSGSDPGLFLKRVYVPRWSSRWRGALRGTLVGLHRGHAEYLALNALRWAGVPAVRPVAYGARLVVGFVAASILITEAVPDSVNLTTFAQQLAAGERTLSLAQRREMLARLAALVADMHAAGVSHGNLFWRNVMVRPAPDGGYEFFLLDAQPLRFWERVRAPRRWWLRELAQLCTSAVPFTTRSERLRFVRAYLGNAPLSAALKSHLREIERMARAGRPHEDRRVWMNRLFECWRSRLAQEAARSGPGASPPVAPP
ncbi:MAG: hypothetical protein IPM13_08460 [Phycisphaerales bacterium]|nr:hypothetical protein [Phycisphaerales bacterium]